MNLSEPDVFCGDCGGTFYTPTKVREEIERAQQDAYAEGRQDQAEEDKELLRWAYSKLHHINFTKQDDALMLDRFKLLLEHGASV